MGDVAAIAGDVPVPVRLSPGMPPYGKVVDAGISLGDVTVMVLGPKMATGPVLSDPARLEAICGAAESAMHGFLEGPSHDSLYRQSNAFSEAAGLEGPEVSSALRALRSAGFNAGMCMLGNSVFTDAPPEEALSAAGSGAKALVCRPTGRRARVTRRG